ncbi:3-oxoacyl-ACP synthase III family protein [Streptomyces sp. NPDC088789]|uniref:3-oxoacyl-ACP synthase III family protein n=1 Tax=Streptomyces sp. NPDC088789 TaxID=3365899 RepID=UPI0037F519C6
MAIGVLSIGSHAPGLIVNNRKISEWTGAGEDWIEQRTGVLERRYAEPGTATSDLAMSAALEALEAAGPGAGERLSALIVATCTPDVPQPATAAILQHKLGLRAVPSFDLNAVCSGFLYGLTLGEAMLSGRFTGGYALVVGADMFSAIMDRTDRRTVSLFGDGAGAVVLGEVPEGYGIQAVDLVTDGDLHHYVGVEAGGTRTPLDGRARARGAHFFRMDGRSVRNYALVTLRKTIGNALSECDLGFEDIDRFIFHQANTRLLEHFAAEVGLDMAQITLTAPFLGNTAAASIPLTLHQAHRERPLQRGERILMASVGGGMTAGAVVLTWY